MDTTSAPAEVVSFVNALFDPQDLVCLRFIETWTENGQKKSDVKQRHWLKAKTLCRPETWSTLAEQAAIGNANQFFGVCPRFAREFDLAAQIRLVRTLWADLDHCSVAEAKQRCVDALLPEPSVIVNSGNGVHLYWLLTEPYAIDDVGDPVPKSEIDKQTLSPKTQHVQAIQQGMALKIGGDATHDLSRILRLPETLNRKDARNGKEPVPCTLVECDSSKRYPLSRFEQYAVTAKAVSSQPVKTPAETQGLGSSGKPLTAMTAAQKEKFKKLYAACKKGEGDRSRNDNALLCHAVVCDLGPDSVWQAVSGISKFAARGRKYFDTSWASAVKQVQQDKAFTAEFPLPVVAAQLPEIVVTNKQLPQITDAALDALQQANHPPTLFQRAGTLVRLRIDPETKMPSFEVLRSKALRGILARVADWKKIEKKGKAKEEKVSIIVPDHVADDLLALPSWDMPPIKAIIEAPVFTGDGNLVAQVGYDAASMLWFHPAPGFTLPEIPDNPTAEDVVRAKQLLLEDLLVDFPFVNDASRANALALLLLPFVRPMIHGPTPLHVIDAPTEGTGKDKLANCFCVLGTGREGHTNPECHGEEEWKKTITSLLSQGPVYIYWENVNYALNSATLTKVVSGRYHQDRLLGKNDTVRKMPVECVWLATGNNVKASKELTRRCVWIRLDAMMERPDTRKEFKHPLPEWAKANRGVLVAACLTLIKAWIVAGRPRRKGEEPMGGFEAWEETMAGILDVAGVPGFLTNRGELFEDVNTTDQEWREFVAAWALAHVTNPVTAKELFTLAQKQNLLPSVLATCKAKDDKSLTHHLGMALARQKDKVYGHWRIEKAEPDTHSKVQRYKLRRLEAGPEEPTVAPGPVEGLLTEEQFMQELSAM